MAKMLFMNDIVILYVPPTSVPPTIKIREFLSRGWCCDPHPLKKIKVEDKTLTNNCPEKNILRFRIPVIGPHRGQVK